MNPQSPFSNYQTKDVEQVSEPKKVKGGIKLLRNKDKILVVLLLLLVLVAGGLGFLYYKERQKAVNPTVAASEEAKLLIERVGRHILLPEEDPGIATIVDIDKLRQNNPEFYANAQNGYKLLVYKNKAILYDPETDKVINLAPIVNTDTEATPNPTSTPSTAPSD